MKPSFMSPNETRSAISRQSSSSKSVEATSGGSSSIRKPSPLFGGAGIREPSPLFVSFGAPQPSPTVDLTAEATDACAASRRLSPLPLTGLSANSTTFIPSSFHFAPVQNNVVAESISASVASSTANDSGRDTPSCIDNAMPIQEMAMCKDDKKGRDKGVGNYSVQEHVNLLRIMSSNPTAFNASESSPEWREVYVEMCKSHYSHWGSTPRLSSTLHAHVVEMYGALKKGMRHLSLMAGAPKCPASYLEADDAELEIYVTSLFEVLISDKKKYQAKNWWSIEVISMLLLLHLQYNSKFGNKDQSLEWLEGKALETKSKFEKDQKNREAELALKRKKEEEEQQEASKNRKMVAESSVMLTATLGNTLNQLITARSNNDNVDGKLSEFKKDLLKELDAREKQAEQKLSDKLDEKFSELIRVLRGG